MPGSYHVAVVGFGMAGATTAYLLARDGHRVTLFERAPEVLPVAARQGFSPDAMACTGDAADGRPTPLLYYRNLLDLGIWPASATVKVDDTEVGIAEGLNAGGWTVGVAMTGNLVGLSRQELVALPAEERIRLRQSATGKMLAAGAHFVIDCVADLLPVLDAIEGRMLRGERP